MSVVLLRRGGHRAGRRLQVQHCQLQEEDLTVRVGEAAAGLQRASSAAADDVLCLLGAFAQPEAEVLHEPGRDAPATRSSGPTACFHLCRGICQAGLLLHCCRGIR